LSHCCLAFLPRTVSKVASIADAFPSTALIKASPSSMSPPSIARSAFTTSWEHFQRSFKKFGVTATCSPMAPLFVSQTCICKFSKLINETSNHFYAKSSGCQVHANATKFDHLLDEKYGIYCSFITNHLEFKILICTTQCKYTVVDFHPIQQADPPIPHSMAIILLFMVQWGGVKWQILVLAFLFLLVGLHPWALVALVLLVNVLKAHHISQRVGHRPYQPKPIQVYYHSRDDTAAVTDAAKMKRKSNKNTIFCSNHLIPIEP